MNTIEIRTPEQVANDIILSLPKSRQSVNKQILIELIKLRDKEVALKTFESNLEIFTRQKDNYSPLFKRHEQQSKF